MSNRLSDLKQDPNLSHMARSASYDHIPSLNSGHGNGTIDVKRTFSEVNLPHAAESRKSPDAEDFTTGKEILRRSSLRSSKEKLGNNADDATDRRRGNSEGTNSSKSVDTPPQQPRSKAGVFSSLTRLSSKASRTPSPPVKEKDAKSRRSRESSRRPNQEGGPVAESKQQEEPVPRRKNRRPLSAFVPKGKDGSSSSLSRSPSLQSLRRRASLDRLTASAGASDKDVPPVPQAPKSPARLGKATDIHRKKDELWSVFRGLDADYQKFQSKSSAFKANVVRLTLIPCLSRYAQHPSTKSLRPEDLDRRINILNKWWTGLLEMLNGKNCQSMSGSDRPVYLDGILAIMSMPEWRIPAFATTSPAALQKQSITKKANPSLDSTGSDFLTESIHHNIRNIFSQNLLSQTAYCVDKMSMRHTPASVVAFCGKTCAYAFFFCPQVADVLVRLWNITPDLLRSVTSRFDLDPSLSRRAAQSEDIGAYFPVPVRSLSFVSHASFVRYLRAKVLGPMSASHINWFGPWTSRWAGRDTDLFYVFVKHFHILITEFLPPNTPPSSFVYVPGLVPVHAQMLTVVENTVNKQHVGQPQDTLQGPTSATFDDMMDGPDAPATALPLGTANKFRAMSENRLVMMLKDFLHDSTVQTPTKQILAESFCGILKLAARRTSLFNHNGCFTLCDFVEELASIVPPYCSSSELPDFLDWQFWLEVCRQMMLSNNSLTEVRAFTFIFAMWDAINSVGQRKEHLCLDMLLDERSFYRYFSHWSPMVRSYFHRLLCWRIARFDGEATELDMRIYFTLVDRLSKVWNYFLSFQTRAGKLLSPPLSTAPCPPAPGRRLIIIRNDYDHSPSNLFFCLGDVPTSLPTAPTGQDRRNTDADDDEATSGASQPQIKKGWKMLRTMFSSTPNHTKPGEVTPPGSKSEDGDDSFKNLGNPRDDNPQDGTSATANQDSSDEGPQNRGGRHRRSSFRFTLEWTDRQRRIARDRPLYPPVLPRPTQRFIHSNRSQAVSQSDSTSLSNSFSGTGSTNGSETDSEEDNDGHLISHNDGDQVTPTTASNSTLKATTMTGKAAPRPPAAPAPVCGNAPGLRLVESKYAGRALAEWALVVSECDNFFQRRRDEGVPSDKLVEVPTLSVESFRK